LKILAREISEIYLKMEKEGKRCYENTSLKEY